MKNVINILSLILISIVILDAQVLDSSKVTSDSVENKSNAQLDHKQDQQKPPKKCGTKIKKKVFKIFNHVIWSTVYIDNPDNILSQANLLKGNSILVIDCSSKFQSKSILYKRRCNKVKKRRFLRRGDFLKIYLNNINKYKYNIEINNEQQDYKYAEGIDNYPITPENTKPPDSKITTDVPNTETAKRIIKKYALAVDSMELFIAFVKNNSSPSSQELEKNKLAILKNLQNNNLISSDHVIGLFDSLDSIERENITIDFQKAKLFSSTLNELKSLSYIVEATLLPMQIKGFDEFKLTITIKDKKGKIIDGPEDYIYQIIGGVKIDQSFGFIGHGLSNNSYAIKTLLFRDTSYATKGNGERIRVLRQDGSLKDSISNIGDLSRKQILHDSTSNKFSIGITTLTHFYYRCGFINLGPEIGFALDFYPDQKIRYLMGGSIMFADGRHRISVDAGYAFGNIDILHPAYQPRDYLEGIDATIPLVEKSQRSWYFGISYNVPLSKNTAQK